jgi:hypothetical protein
VAGADEAVYGTIVSLPVVPVMTTTSTVVPEQATSPKKKAAAAAGAAAGDALLRGVIALGEIGQKGLVELPCIHQSVIQVTNTFGAADDSHYIDNLVMKHMACHPLAFRVSWDN